MNSDSELLILLESPLLDVMAPELLDLRTRLHAVAEETKSDCTPCQQREQYAALLRLQLELSDRLQTNPTLEALAPQLLASAKQVYDAR